jgi:hypothetical protein
LGKVLCPELRPGQVIITDNESPCIWEIIENIGCQSLENLWDRKGARRISCHKIAPMKNFVQYCSLQLLPLLKIVELFPQLKFACALYMLKKYFCKDKNLEKSFCLHDI